MIIDWQTLLTIDGGKKPPLSDWMMYAESAYIQAVYLGENVSSREMLQLFIYKYGGLHDYVQGK